MRILFVKRLYEPVGGSETLAYHLATGLVARGHDVRVVCMWPAGREHRYRVDRLQPRVHDGYRVFRDRGVEVVQMKPPGGLLGAAVDWTALLDLMRMDVLEAYARDRDVVHNISRESIESSITVAERVGAALVLTPLVHPGQFHGGDTPTDIRNYGEADAITMRSFRTSFAVRTKADRTPVTEVDEAVERMVRARLERERPDDAIVGEEFGN